MLNDNVDDAFEVSNSTMLRVWNQSMEIMEILDQITTTYGRPTPNALLHNDMLFRSAYSPADAPETLFRRIEDCQEIQLLGEVEYTPKHSYRTLAKYATRPPPWGPKRHANNPSY